MEVRLQKWGNSKGIRIPSNFIKLLNLEEDKLDLKYEDDKIIVSKIKKEPISLKKRFDEYNGENLAKDFEWDGDYGREQW